MRKDRFKIRRYIYPILWSGIVIITIYLLLSFTNFSFSDNVGQADNNIINSLFSGLSCKVVKEGSLLVSYCSGDNDKYTYQGQPIFDKLALAKFADDTDPVTVQAMELKDVLNENSSLKTKLNLGTARNKKSNPSTAENTIETMNSKVITNTIDFYEISNQNLSKEYILSNGTIYNNLLVNSKNKDDSDELQVGYEHGQIEETEDSSVTEDKEATEAANTVSALDFTMDQLKDMNFLVRHFYIVDSSTKITKKLFDADKLLSKDMKLKQENDKPQILIYHTHSQEGYTDSKAGKRSDSVVGVGDLLTEILEEKYDYNVIHDTTKYDIVDGVENRNKAYSQAEDGITKILKDNPTIEVVIDLHRDSGEARTVKIDGKETAKVMLFNGLSRDQNGPIEYLKNPNLQDNLAFSLQLQLKSLELYPGLFNRNYLKSYRYNMNVRPKSLLVELGTVGNTVESAKNAMEPFAKVLDAVLQGE